MPAVSSPSTQAFSLLPRLIRTLEQDLPGTLQHRANQPTWNGHTIRLVLKHFMAQYIPQNLRINHDDPTMARQLLLCGFSTDLYSQFAEVDTTRGHQVSFRNRSATDIRDTPRLISININDRNGINAQDCMKNTPLTISTYFMNTPLTRELLELNANPNIPNSLNLSPLNIAVMRKLCSSDIQNLYQYGANQDHQDLAGNSPLMYACVSGNMGLAEVLLTQTGADVNQRNHIYETPLVVACSYGSNDFVELLVHAGAVLDFRSTCQRTALFFAIMYGYPECVNTLLKFGADMDLQDSMGKTPIDYAIEKQKKAETKEDKFKYGEILKLLANPPKRVTLSRFSKSNQLKNTCRNRIRQLLNSSSRDHLFTKKVKLLPLPNEQKEYLQGNSTQSLNDALRLHP